MAPVAGLVYVMADFAFGLAAEYVELVKVKVIVGMHLCRRLSLVAFVAVIAFMARFAGPRRLVIQIPVTAFTLHAMTARDCAVCVTEVAILLYFFFFVAFNALSHGRHILTGEIGHFVYVPVTDFAVRSQERLWSRITAKALDGAGECFECLRVEILLQHTSVRQKSFPGLGGIFLFNKVVNRLRLVLRGGRRQ